MHAPRKVDHSQGRRVAIGSLVETNATIGAVEVGHCMCRARLIKTGAPSCKRKSEQGGRTDRCGEGWPTNAPLKGDQDKGADLQSVV
eukprot:2468196-Pyramimonas_sp.AAC.2